MEGYTLLEYIESDGTQYIETGFKSVSFVMKLDIQFFKRTNRSLMGFSEEAACYFGINTEGYYELGGGNVSTFSGLQRREIVIESTSSGMSLTAGDSVISRSRTEAVNTSFLLFGAPSTSGLASYPCSARLYSCKIYVGESLVRDYVPCMDNNGVYGLYDKVNGVFYTSATDSGFTGKWAENKTLNVSMSEYRHRMLNLIPKTGLPKGYFRCEYIESDGTNFIDTGFKPNNNTRVTCDFEFITTPSETKALFGARTSASSKNYAFLYASSTGKLRSDYNNSYNQEFDYITGRFQIDKNKETTTISGESKSYTNSLFQCDYNMYLFSLNNAGESRWLSSIRMYSCQIYDNGVKVRDYVPCVSPEGYFGLYDLVTDEFYGLVQQKASMSYTVNLGMFGNWTKGGFTNPDSSKYDAYMSSSSKGVDYGYDIMRITITGYDEFTCYIRSYAESNYDYTVIGELDKVLSYDSTYDSTGVKAHTRGNQQSGTNIGSYTKVVYTGIGGGTHFIEVMYRKDWADNSGDDRGYLLIDKTTVSSGGAFQVIGRGKVILPSGYINAEYIASDGNQWIDTGHRPTSENLRVVLDFEYTASYSSKSLYGSQKASSLVFSILPHSGFFLVGSSGSSLLSTSYDIGTRYLLDTHAKNGNFSVSLNNSIRNTTYTTPLYKDNTLYLFASHNGTRAAEMSSLKMYFLQIHDNGTFTKFFVPCSKDGVFGLYEMFEGIFYSSEGSSEFTGESDGDNEGSGSLPDYSAYRGVYIEDVDGYLYTEAEWDGSKTANGVAVLTDNCRFVIALQDANGSNTTKWTDPSFYNVEGVTNTESITDACKDYNGRNNTDVMISDLNTGALSANYCKAYDFPNGQKGYLGAAGEWQSALDNKAAIESALSKCGGTSLDEGMTEFYWTSTQYTDFESWVADWSYVELNYSDKGLYASVRALTPLKQDS